MGKKKRSEQNTEVQGPSLREFPIQALDCADCARLLEKAVCKVQGVAGVQADFIKSSLRVKYIPGQVQPGEIIRAIEVAGYAVPAEVST